MSENPERWQQRRAKSFAKIFEPGETFELNLVGMSNRWWVLFPVLIAAAARQLVLTDRNVYFCRVASRNLEVLVKYPIESANLELTGGRLAIGPEHVMWLPYWPMGMLARRKARRIIVRAQAARHPA